MTGMAVFAVSGFISPVGMAYITDAGRILPFWYLHGILLGESPAPDLLPAVPAPLTALLLCGIALAISRRLFRGL